MTDELPAIAVTGHCARRALERFPDLHFADRHRLGRHIMWEVGEAIRAGRMATRLPAFAVRAGCRQRPDARYMGGTRRNQSSRFVWTEAEDRVYVVARRPSATVVVTVFAPGVTEAEAAA